MNVLRHLSKSRRNLNGAKNGLTRPVHVLDPGNLKQRGRFEGVVVSQDHLLTLALPYFTPTRRRLDLYVAGALGRFNGVRGTRSLIDDQVLPLHPLDYEIGRVVSYRSSLTLRGLGFQALCKVRFEALKRGLDIFSFLPRTSGVDPSTNSDHETSSSEEKPHPRIPSDIPPHSSNLPRRLQ